MLKHLAIKNFRSCAGTEVDLGSPLVGLIGRNGAGKTTILQAIAGIAAFGAGTGAESWRPFGIPTGASFSLEFTTDAGQFLYTVSLLLKPSVPGTPPRRPELKEELTLVAPEGTTPLFLREGGKILTPGRHEQLQINEGISAISALASILPTSDQLAQRITSVRDYLGSTAYYTLEDRSDNPDVVSEADYRAFVQQYQSAGPSTAPIAYRLVYMWHNEKPLLDELRNLLGPKGLDILDRIDVLPLSTGKSVSPEAPAEEKRYLVRFVPGKRIGGTGRALYYSSLSGGTRRVLQLLTILLFDRRAIVLLEQPEDSIHYGLLERVLGIFREYSDKCQLVFSTHSSDIMNVLKPEEIRLVFAQGGATKTRALTPSEVDQAKTFMRDEGTLESFVRGLDTE